MINSDFIIKAFNHYDKQNTKYAYHSEELVTKPLTNDEDNTRIVNKSYLKSYAQVLGIFHEPTNVFIWAWALPHSKIEDTTIVNELLRYGLTITPESNNPDHYLIKSLLVNSRIYVDIDFNLDLLLAISSYILKDKCDFISRQLYNKTFSIYHIYKFSN